MNSDAMLWWLEEAWMEITPVSQSPKKEEHDIEDAAPWNKGRIW